MHPTNPEILFAGYGNLWKTTNGGTLWNNITRNLPNELYFTYLAVDDADPKTAWITCAGFEDGLKVFKTNDGGETWDNITMNLPNLPANCIVEHHNNEYNPVYVGMDVGVYYTNDTLNEWMLFSNELPNVIISELEIHEARNKLYAATFGRGIWNIDLYESEDDSGIESPIYDIQMEVFPNPSNGDFDIFLSNFNIDNASLKIIDVAGVHIYSSPITNRGLLFRESYNLDLKPGLYYIIITDNKHTKATKFIVQ
ncbi:T9SS type A sorting domain-containing protein [Bacteroidota bacterium]